MFSLPVVRKVLSFAFSHITLCSLMVNALSQLDWVMEKTGIWLSIICPFFSKRKNKTDWILYMGEQYLCKKPPLSSLASLLSQNMGLLPGSYSMAPTLQILRSWASRLKSHGWLWCLSENGPYKLIYLNAWSPVGETIWEGLGSVTLLDDVYH